MLRTPIFSMCLTKPLSEERDRERGRDKDLQRQRERERERERYRDLEREREMVNDEVQTCRESSEVELYLFERCEARIL